MKAHPPTSPPDAASPGARVLRTPAQHPHVAPHDPSRTSSHHTSRALSLSDAIAQMERSLTQLLSSSSTQTGVASKTPTWMQICIPLVLDESDALDLLRLAPPQHRLYWTSREREQHIVGIGCAQQIDANDLPGLLDVLRTQQRNLHHDTTRHLPLLEPMPPTPRRYYGGMRFLDQPSPCVTWQDFGSGLFWCPRFEVRLEAQRAFLLGHIRDDEVGDQDVLTALHKLLKSLKQPQSPPEPTPALHARLLQHCPNLDTWTHNLQTVLRIMTEGELEKVVLARQSTLELQQHADPVELFARLKANNTDTFLFYFQPSTDSAFLSATPERLFRRNARQLYSEALAGTRPRHHHPLQDEFLSRSLRRSEKDVHEHLLVLEMLRGTLAPLCQSLRSKQNLGLLRLSYVQHLWSQLQGTLHDGIDDFHLLQQLHPTPAVGGRPTQEAIEQIARHEGFDRGWYAAPIGWFEADGAEFAVAIRSGLLHQDRLILFAGAGIVPGSQPQQEWSEIEQKLSPFLRLITTAQQAATSPRHKTTSTSPWLPQPREFA